VSRDWPDSDRPSGGERETQSERSDRN